MTLGLVLMSALTLPGLEPGAPSGTAPRQVLASIDSKGNLKITYATSVGPGFGGGAMSVPVEQEKGKPPVPVKVRVTSLMVTSVELDAKHVKAYTADGRPVAGKRLAEMLAKDRAVLVSTDGKKVDPYYLELYKEGTLVLVLPANTLNLGSGPFGGYGGSIYSAPTMPAPAPLEPLPPLKKRRPLLKPRPVERKDEER